MTAKLDGTNGLLQAYDYQTPATGFSYTFAAGTQTLFMVPAATLATGTITMPASPTDGMTITFSSSQQITALTLQGNTGQSISSAVTFLPAKTAVSYVYRLSNTTWYPSQSVPGTGSQLVSGTSQASTSGTSIDFTGIPSWVKRVTVLFSGVSLSSTANILVQLGAGSVQNTGYVGGTINQTPSVTNSTAGFIISTGNAAASMNGALQISTLGSNIWAATGAFGRADAAFATTAGSVTLSGTIDRVRITTTSTDTFDAGSINILYE